MIFRKDNAGWFAITILTTIPVVRWMMLVPLDMRFRSLSVTLTSIADILGFIGMMLFAITLIMSIRASVFEDFFGGMNKVYVAHHLAGSLSLVFLLFHPLFSVAMYATISMKSAALLLLPGADWSINFGIYSLLLMMILLIITIFMKLPYQIWKLTHQFLGLAFFLGGLHVYLIPTDVAVDPFLRYYTLGFAVVALIGYTYRTLLGRVLVKRTPYQVAAVRQVGKDILELELNPLQNPITYMPGQFMFIHFKSQALSREIHPFSISSSPSQRELRITVKALGDYTRMLPNLKRGDKAFVEGPYGRFSAEMYSNRNQIWIAGGIGITPFVSMARSFYNLDYRVDLYYIVRSATDAVYAAELAYISKNNPNFRLIVFETAKYGHANMEWIGRTSGGLADKEIFLCGPPPMMHTMKQQMRQLKVPRTRIHSEEFEIQ